MKYLNDEQQSHVDALNAHPDKVCGCGWYWKDECATLCFHREKQLPEEARINDFLNTERERCAQVIEAILDPWKTSFAPTQSYTKYWIDRAAKEIRDRKR